MDYTIPYNFKPRTVKVMAMQVLDNYYEVAEWCRGVATQSGDDWFVLLDGVMVGNGSWIVYIDGGFRFYTDELFKLTFEHDVKADIESLVNQAAWVRENRDHTEIYATQQKIVENLMNLMQL